MDEETLRRTVTQLLIAQRKIEAVKLVRERLGLGLAEAKSYVDAIQAGHAPPAALIAKVGTATPGVPADVHSLIRAGNLIGAIKLHRQLTGLGLAEAKQAVETMRDQMLAESRGVLPSALSGAAPAPAPSQSAFASSSAGVSNGRARFAESQERPPGSFPVGLFLVAVLGAAGALVALFWLLGAR